MGEIKIKRIYEPVDKADGTRILVDRLWPRGLTKGAAHIDEWMKSVAPTADLRKWFNHDAAKWEEFKQKYINELRQSDAVKDLLAVAKKSKTVTLLYSAHDEQHNQAVVLQQFIKDGNT